jgi:hypothetical protein
MEASNARAGVPLKRDLSSPRLPVPVSKLWARMVANVLHVAFRSFVHTGDFSVSTADGGSFRVGVCHQNRAVGTEFDAYRTAIGHPLVRCKEPRPNIPAAAQTGVRLRTARTRPYSHSACCGSRSHAARSPCRRESPEACLPASSIDPATRCARPARSPASWPLRPRRILWYPIVHRPPPVAIGPAVETPVADRG